MARISKAQMTADIAAAIAAKTAAEAEFVGPIAPSAPLEAVTPPAATTPAPSTPTAAVGQSSYTIQPKAKLIAPHLTLQRGCTVAVGAHWRSNGHKATNTRSLVIEALAGLGMTFTHAEAMAALKPLKDAALLGSGTPASYLRAFVKDGYLALGAA